MDLSKALVKLYESPEKLKEFSENGKKIVKKYYSKAAFIEEYRKIYNELGGYKWQE